MAENMTDGEFLHTLGDDANKWADAFLERFPNCGIHQHTLMGWFANAIEHSYDVRTGRVHNGDHAQFLIDLHRDALSVTQS